MTLLVFYCGIPYTVEKRGVTHFILDENDVVVDEFILLHVTLEAYLKDRGYSIIREVE